MPSIWIIENKQVILSNIGNEKVIDMIFLPSVIDIVYIKQNKMLYFGLQNLIMSVTIYSTRRV